MLELDFIRIILAFFCGYFLCLSGSLSQLTTNNGISSPSTLGMDGFAVAFVILTYFLPVGFFDWLSPTHLSFCIFLSLTVPIFISRRPKEITVWKELPTQKIIIFGLAFNLFIGAIFSIVQFMFVALNFDFPTSIWFGSLKQYELSYLFPFSLLFLICLIYTWQKKSEFELLNFGKAIAENVGINLRKLILFNLLIALVCTGLVISYFGVFSFLGLVFPHILRSFRPFKDSFKYEIVLGPLVMGVVFSFLDFLCFYFLIYGAEVPVGMVSGVLGSFFLIFLVLKSKLIRS